MISLFIIKQKYPVFLQFMNACTSIGEKDCAGFVKEMNLLCYDMKKAADLLNKIGEADYKSIGGYRNTFLIQKLWGEGKQNPENFKNHANFKKSINLSKQFDLKRALTEFGEWLKENNNKPEYCTLDEVLFLNVYGQR